MVPPRLRALTVVAIRVVLLLGLSGACTPQSEPPPDDPEMDDPPHEPAAVGAPKSRTVYVPAYSHLPSGGKEPGFRALVSILLSIRNVDTREKVKITHVDYFDTPGNRVRRYLKTPRVLNPLETAEFVVDVRDGAGGSGANFLVYWEGPTDAHPLLVEAIMSGFLGGGYISFVSRGIELDRRPDASSLTSTTVAPVGAP